MLATMVCDACVREQLEYSLSIATTNWVCWVRFCFVGIMSGNETVYPRVTPPTGTLPTTSGQHLWGVCDYLKQPDSLLLSWKEEDDASSTKKARELGAEISESRHLYLDLQHKYTDF